MRRALLAVSVVFGTWTAFAHDGAHKHRAVPAGHAWDFTLPTLDGGGFVQASTLNGPVLVNFWGRDCVPCRAELPRLRAFATANPRWTVLLVSTDATADAREFVQRHGVQLTALRPGAHVGALMRGAGNRGAGLPFTVGLRADTRDARLCDGQLGELVEADLDRIAAACTSKAPP